MAKLPNKLHIVSRECTLPQLGFLHGYEPGKPAFEKKRHTQYDWAYYQIYSSVFDPQLVEINSEYWITGNRRVYDAGRGPATIVPFRELLKCQPQIWDNVPLEGFKIMESVSRYSTSNKLWRILDPRNMEFEITTGCLEEIMMATTITKGLIEGKCAWMSSKNLIVT